MRVELFLALRYLTHDRARALLSVVTAIAVGGVAVGVAALVIAISLMTGFSSDIQERILGAEAHVFLYGDKVSGGIARWEEVASLCESLPHVVAAAPNVLDAGMLEGPVERDRASLRGILPGREVKVSDLARAVVAGSLEGLLPPAPGRRPGILLGRDLALELGVGVGDTLRYYSFSGTTLSPLGPVPRRVVFEVAGIFETGLFEYDRTWALAELGVVQDLIGVPGAATTVKLRVDGLDHIRGVSEAVRARFGDRYSVKDLLTLNRPLFSAFKLEKLLMWIVVGLIVVVASLNIVTTLTMMVMDKTRDIGILMAMGLDAEGVRRVFILQGLIIGLIGMSLGLLLGVGSAVAADRFRLVELDTTVYYISHLPFRVQVSDVLLIALMAVTVSVLATLAPSRQAARLDPVEALRYE